MTSRRDSTKSYRAIPRKPSVKPKSSHIEGNSLDGSETDYMNDDLLKEEYYDNDTSPPYNYQDLPKQPENDSRDIASHRLVIAIDYGTTYTGIHASCPKACCSLLTVLSRGCFRYPKILRSKHSRHQGHRQLGREHEQQP